MIESSKPVSDAVALSSGADDWSTKALPLTGNRSVRLSDGPHGLRVQADDAASLELRRSIAATCFPPAVGLGATWNPQLIERVGRALAAESRAAGVDVLLGPGINIKRSPLCGRNFEYFSEDPHLTAELALALVHGLQRNHVGACVKHFAVNNQETNRMRVDAIIDDRTLREIYLPAFERVVTEGDPWMLMSSYNAVNGTTMSQNAALLTGILRDEWGYSGVVVSDWAAVYDRVASVRAGLDLEMPHADAESDRALQSALDAGQIALADIERAAHRVMHLTERAHQARTEPIDLTDTLKRNHLLAIETARQAIVLLKNDNGCLPIDASRGIHIAVIGDLARNPRYQGAGSSFVNATRVENLADSLEHLAGNIVGNLAGDLAGDRARITVQPAFNAEHDDAAIARLASTADITILCVGLRDEDESEGYDRQHLHLPPDQVALIQKIGNIAPKLVVVLTNGGVVSTTEWQNGADAIVEGWLLGQGGGRALAEVVLGIHNPSGRLAETIPVQLEDSPSHLHFAGKGVQAFYGERHYVGYRGFEAMKRPVAYPFGHGLSYTTFAYTEVDVCLTGTGDDLECELSFTVTNTGTRAGAEVAQVYVAPPTSATDRAPIELRAFERVELESAQHVRIVKRLSARSFARWDAEEARWIVDSGQYLLQIGASSHDVRLTAVADIAGNERRQPLTPVSTLAEWIVDPAGNAAIRSVRVLHDFVEGLTETDPTTALMLQQVPLEKVAAIFGLRSATLDLHALAELANTTV